MTNFKIKAIMKKMLCPEMYRYKNDRKETIIMYKGNGRTCEITCGRFFVKELMFSDTNGKLLGYHNFKTGEMRYDKTLAKEVDDIVKSNRRIKI